MISSHPHLNPLPLKGEEITRRDQREEVGRRDWEKGNGTVTLVLSRRGRGDYAEELARGSFRKELRRLQ